MPYRKNKVFVLTVYAVIHCQSKPAKTPQFIFEKSLRQTPYEITQDFMGVFRVGDPRHF